MKKVGRVLLSLAVVIVLAIAVSITSNPVQASNPFGVVVTNTPLPVQGNISVANTPNVNVTNTPSVTIANSSLPVNGNVAVTNAVDGNNNPLPLTVASPGQPYMDACGTSGALSCNFAAVPAGMRLVVQAVSFSSTSSQGNVYQAGVYTLLNSYTRYSFLVLRNTGTDENGQLHQAAQQTTVLYSDPGSTPTCLIGASGSFNYVCTLSGYLVPAP